MKTIGIILAVYVTYGTFWNLSTGHTMHIYDIYLYAFLSFIAASLIFLSKKKSTVSINNHKSLPPIIDSNNQLQKDRQNSNEELKAEGNEIHQNRLYSHKVENIIHIDSDIKITDKKISCATHEFLFEHITKINVLEERTGPRKILFFKGIHIYGSIALLSVSLKGSGINDLIGFSIILILIVIVRLKPRSIEYKIEVETKSAKHKVLCTGNDSDKAYDIYSEIKNALPLDQRLSIGK